MSIREAPEAPLEHSEARPQGLPSPPQGPPAGPPTNGRRAQAKAEPAAVRRVRRIVRHIDLWSVFRLSLVLYLTLLVVFMLAGVGLWLAATATGARHSVEHFIAATLVFKGFKFNSMRILSASAAIGAVMAVVGSGLTVVAAAFYNLISDMVGGVEITVIEEDPSHLVV